MPPRKALTLFAALLLIAAGTNANDDLRTFRNADGQTLRAKVLERKGDVVVIELEDGRTVDAGIGFFSADDRRFLRTWTPPETSEPTLEYNSSCDVHLTFSMVANEKATKTDGLDDKQRTYVPVVRVTNNERRTPVEKARGTVVIIGESVLERREWELTSRQNFTISVQPDESEAVDLKEITYAFDDNPSNGAAFGYDYSGYIVILRNQAGEVCHIRASRSDWEERALEIAKLKTNRSYDRNFSKTVKPSRYP